MPWKKYIPLHKGKNVIHAANRDQTYKMVYDTGDPRDPEAKDWFLLKVHDKKWKKDVSDEKGERCYDAEHVLEWQMLQDFIEEDKDKGDNSRCAHLLKYFTQSMPLDDIEVEVAKDYKKALKFGEHFDYEKKNL
jgi:hypothetical protein